MTMNPHSIIEVRTSHDDLSTLPTKLVARRDRPQCGGKPKLRFAEPITEYHVDPPARPFTTEEIQMYWYSEAEISAIRLSDQGLSESLSRLVARGGGKAATAADYLMTLEEVYEACRELENKNNNDKNNNDKNDNGYNNDRVDDENLTLGLAHLPAHLAATFRSWVTMSPTRLGLERTLAPSIRPDVRTQRRQLCVRIQEIQFKYFKNGKRARNNSFSSASSATSCRSLGSAAQGRRRLSVWNRILGSSFRGRRSSPLAPKAVFPKQQPAPPSSEELSGSLEKDLMWQEIREACLGITKPSREFALMLGQASAEEDRPVKSREKMASCSSIEL